MDDFSINDFWQQNPAIDSVTIEGRNVRVGDRVTLRPNKSADILDVALTGKVAVVEAIERDFDDNIHLAVVLEDDPGREFGMMRLPGHRFFFSAAEVAPLADNEEAA